MIYDFLIKSNLTTFFIVVNILTFFLTAPLATLVFYNSDFVTPIVYLMIFIATTIESLFFTYLINLIRQSKHFE